MKIPKTVLRIIANAVLAVLAVLKLTTANRIVVALSPLLTSAAGAVTVLIAHYIPMVGNHFTTIELTGLFFSGALFAAAHILMWLHGWQKAESPQAQGPPGPTGPPGPAGVTGRTGSPGPVVVASPAPPVHDVGG